MSKLIILIIGTRPEAIKMAPVYFALKRNNIPVKICATFQHTNLLQEVFDIFGIVPDFNLNIMKAGQDISYLTQAVLRETRIVFEQENPSLVLVQGDTTTAFAAALSAFYLNIEVGHIEAGLRTYDISSPFPEEFNRQAVSLFAKFNFAPTSLAVQALQRSNIKQDSIFCSGNTIVDALSIMQRKVEQQEVVVSSALKNLVSQCDTKNQKKILLTVHRRESFNGGIKRVLETIKEYALAHPDVFFFYPFHPNPVVQKAILEVGLKDVNNIYMCEPLLYPDLIYLLVNMDLILTDSGGIQEEAISLGKTVLVARDKTERMEGVNAGIAHLVGTNKRKIKMALNTYIRRENVEATQIYGNGRAAEKIVEIIERNGKAHEKSLCSRTRVHRASNSDHCC